MFEWLLCVSLKAALLSPAYPLFVYRTTPQVTVSYRIFYLFFSQTHGGEGSLRRDRSVSIPSTGSKGDQVHFCLSLSTTNAET